MSQHPLQLVFRFLLELAGLCALAAAGWAVTEAPWRWALAVGLPLLAATVWAVFRVAGDGGAPIVAVSGRLRLAIEAMVLGGAVAALFAARWPVAGGALATTILLHYALAYDRIGRLLRG
ncbi:MAG: YrdB family protein [Myxococcales bacterium]|nr:YrdB family protein [Myxococcales bacterium]